MQKQQAINIVRETFESSFEKGRFASFVKNLLNEPDFNEGFGSRSGQYIPAAFKEYIDKYERLGVYEDSDEKRIDLLIVHLKRDTSIERARSMQRNFIAGYLQGKYGSDSLKDAALVAFVSPNGEDWRFSLVRLEVRLEANDDGKLKVTDQFTPAKRWSFLVGSQEKSHTAQRQFVPIMQNTDENPTLAELEEAFNIETVTKEFFNAYRTLFIQTKSELDKVLKKDAKVKADFERKGIDTVNLAKKLLGQIVFLYYLQKKGWFGVPRNAAWGEGSRQFLRELFEASHGSYKNFFNDILEPLFYEALRMDRSHDDHYYSRFDCKIPFLNGGLFDPMNNYDWVKTDILLPNSLFSHRTKDDPEGDGILDIFDLYNFTVKEDEPFEKEVAIDPELLGKTYEKFNAIRPDNYDEFLKALKSGKKGDESKFNKQYGVYYTPREIVHYMCQQSLINYLHSEMNPHTAHQALGGQTLDMFGNAGKQGQLEITTEHAIEEISKEDIALLIQHGEQWRENEERVDAAGKETDTYSYKMPESIRKNAALIDEKLAAIKVCDPAVGSGAFPVGMMSEIVKARQVLEIYSRPDRSPKESGKKASASTQASRMMDGSVRPVRSAYDFKRECIENSLYGVDIDSGAVEIAKLRLWLSLVVDEDDPQNIKPLPNLDYKIVQGNSLIGVEKNLFNNHLFTELETLKPLFFNATNPAKKQEYKKKIDGLIDQITDGRAQFDFEIYFSEVFHEKGGFNVVTGNPPYLRVQGLQKTQSEYMKYYRENYESANGSFDLYALFIERGFQLLNKHGHFAYIVPHKFFQANFGESLRGLLTKRQALQQIVRFGSEQVFEDATTYTCLLFLSSQPKPEFDLMEVKSLSNGEQTFHAIASRTEHPDYLHARLLAPVYDGKGINWNFTLDEHDTVLTHLRQQKRTLGDVVRKIFQGLATSADKIYILQVRKEYKDKFLCYSEHLDEEIEIERGLVKSFLMGKDVHRYQQVKLHRVVIFPYHIENGKAELMKQSFIKEKFPLGWQYLNQNKKDLENRENGRMKGNEFFAYIYPKNLVEFETPKIMTPEIALGCQMTLDNEGVFYHTTKVYSFVFRPEVKSSSKYWLGLLNSKVLWYFLSKTGYVLRGGYYTFKTDYLKPFPIPYSTPDQEKAIEKLVDRILAAKGKNPQSDTSPLEREIDQLVYELYGLMEEEIKIVEGKHN